MEYMRDKQNRNTKNSCNSLNGITFTRHDFRPTFNKHMGQICQGIHCRFNWRGDQQVHEDQEGEEDKNTGKAPKDSPPNLFALGTYFLFFCVREHFAHFKWRSPSDGYEYNFSDPPLLLIYGDERWWKCFEGELNTQQNAAREGKEEGITTTDDALLEEYLQWAHTEAQRFAKEASAVHLYE